MTIQVLANIIRFDGDDVAQIDPNLPAIVRQCFEAALAQAAGYDAGHSDGYGAGYDDGHSDGYDAGYDDGYDAGYGTGSDAGYNDGYNAGCKAGQERRLP